MARLPRSLETISLFLQRLPGIGEKTANRLAFYLLRIPEEDLASFAHTVAALKKQTKRCRVCQNLAENNLICEVCADTKRNTSVITVVESILDILSFETGGIYNGVYHVLHGRIDPLNRVGPEDITIGHLLQRISEQQPSEIILATNPDVEGEATAVYIHKQIDELAKEKKIQIKVSRLAYGLPMGGNVEYADYVTLKKAIDGRNQL